MSRMRPPIQDGAAFEALGDLRHMQMPPLLLHRVVRREAQFDWAHRCCHTDNWVALAWRRCNLRGDLALPRHASTYGDRGFCRYCERALTRRASGTDTGRE
jgi:hypothetical protein